MRFLFFLSALTFAPLILVAKEPQTWAFEPTTDSFSNDALLDLSYLNEDIAGQSGFVRRTLDGEGFALGDGTPTRFWAVNTTVANKGPVALSEHAKFLAKRGVNMVRFHGQIPQSNENGGGIEEIDEDERRRLWQLVSAMKQEGIYVTFSPYYPHLIRREAVNRWSAPQDSPGMSGLIYFDPAVQRAYKAWLRETRVPKNPYTDIPLKDDPALAIIQMQNEDSLLFWTLNELKGREAKLLADEFGEFLEKKYGSLAKAQSAFGQSVSPDPIGGVKDNWEDGTVALTSIWHLTSDAISGEVARRLSDQAEFLTKLMRDWHLEIARFLRDEIGAKQLFNAGNWRTADDLLLDDLERYSYTSGDIIAVNRYVGRLHSGEHSGWAITSGDQFRETGLLGEPLDLPITLRQPEGYPYIIPETLWVPPIWQQSEAPVVMAAYQALTGIDISYWFNSGQIQWRQPQSANGYLPSIGKWVVNTPQVIGSFPAAALIFRNALIEESEPVVIDHVSLDELWSLKEPLVSPRQGRDPNRDGLVEKLKSYTGVQIEKQAQVSPYSFLAGPVVTKFESEESDYIHPDLEELVDEENRVVTSATRQLIWDWGERFVTIDAPMVQGVIGSLSSRTEFELQNVTIQSDSTYASVIVVSLDEEPISRSSRLLLQIGSTAKPSGWSSKDVLHDGEPVREVVDMGYAPWRMSVVEGKVTLKNTTVSRATILDPNGMAIRTRELSRSNGTVFVQIPKEALYMILE